MTKVMNMIEMEAAMRGLYQEFFGDIMEQTKTIAKEYLIVGILKNLNKIFAEARIGRHETGYDQIIVKTADGEIHSCVIDLDPDEERSAKEWVRVILSIFNRVYSTDYKLD